MGKITPDSFLGPLNEIERKYAPNILYTLGDESLLSYGPKVSIVGSRNASEQGQTRARSLVKSLVDQGAVIVSGLAKGIDTVAHSTAIEFGGRTITVLGTPLDKPSPIENRALFDIIAKEHLAVSQFPFGSTPGRHTFPMRNRTMALISDATVIVEAGEKSGTLHQGWEAIRLDRPLFLLESVANNKELSWPKKMIGYGACVLTRDNLASVLENLPSFSVEYDLAL